ncbi:hypothetical protein [Niallia endozanthoxylica]|uniref:Uncharacterized protein n=1 Tax=Niallia endozanthoxylica TaxID=2036016 RepID=A0A5J5HUD7_9BACI|nr:hypothetical protein [Niallia endozanthoxylica]KAA9023915.1 hypothetical protein F4V44_12320 [Niallia endozanthoxylica]
MIDDYYQYKSDSVQKVVQSLANVGPKRLATVLSIIAMMKDYKENGYRNINHPVVQLEHTRRLFTLLQPMTKKQTRMTQIIRFHVEKNSFTKELQKELNNVSHDCKTIIDTATKLREHIQQLPSNEDLSWSEVLKSDHDKLQILLQNAQKTLTEISNHALSRNANINTVFHTERERQRYIRKVVGKERNSFKILSNSEAIKLFEFLIKDEFETHEEYINRVRPTVESLDSFRIGKVKIRKSDYDIDTKTIRLKSYNKYLQNIYFDEWTNRVPLWKLDLFPDDYFGELPSSLDIPNIDRDTAKILYENQGNNGYSLVVKIEIDENKYSLVVNRIHLNTEWKNYDVKS